LVEKIASDIKKSCLNPNDDEEVIDAVLSFVQDRGRLNPSIHYTGGTPYIPKYPIETLAEGNGNCIDKSILFVSLLESLDYDTILIKESLGHFLAGVYMASPPTHSSTGEIWNLELNNKKYYMCETVSIGLRVGDLPSESQNRSHWAVEVEC
jgi:hypothetical protein